MEDRIGTKRDIDIERMSQQLRDLTDAVNKLTNAFSVMATKMEHLEAQVAHSHPQAERLARLESVNESQEKQLSMLESTAVKQSTEIATLQAERVADNKRIEELEKELKRRSAQAMSWAALIVSIAMGLLQIIPKK